MEINTQPHRQMLRRICTLGRVAGWAMIVMAALYIPSTVYAVLFAHISAGEIPRACLDVAGQILMGLVTLGVVQFILNPAVEIDYHQEFGTLSVSRLHHQGESRISTSYSALTVNQFQLPNLGSQAQKVPRAVAALF